MEKIREGAIDAIMEKERVIMELREQLYTDNDSIVANLHQKVNALIREKDEWEEMHASMVENYEKTLQELQSKLDVENHKFEERILRIESEINERVQTTIQSSIESAKDVENDLMA